MDQRWRSEVGGQRSEVRGQRSEVRWQMASGLFFAVFLAGIVVDEFDPDLSLLEFVGIDFERVHVAGAGGWMNALSVELKAARVAGALEDIAVGRVGNEAAGVRAN